MKPFLVLVFLFCLVFPCFSQSAASQRFQALSDAMGRTLENSNSNLENYNQNVSDSENMRTYLRYRRKYESLLNALKSAEYTMDLYDRTKERPEIIIEHKDKYEKYIKQLQETKTEYDGWVRNVK